MISIEDITAVPVKGGFYFDDQEAIKSGAERKGFVYSGEPLTDGFEHIRQPAEAMSILLHLSDGSVAVGDCAAVQYSGAGGRDSAFDPRNNQSRIETEIGGLLLGRAAGDFLENVRAVETHLEDTGNPLHMAERYGISQALLKAAALANGVTMAEIIADSFETSPSKDVVPIYAQSGDERRLNAEKMILKGVDVIPHGLFNSVEKIGSSGEHLVEYISWLEQRVTELGRGGYSPRFHVDVYGNIGEIFESPYDREEVVEYFRTLSRAADPYDLQIEGPIDEGSQAEQIKAMSELRDGLARAGVSVDIVADEWCNTLEDIQAFVDAGAADVIQIKTPDLGGIHNTVKAVQYCEGTDSRAYIGGSCAETDVSARVSAHVAIGTNPSQILAKPGMGVDEGYMIVFNEMQRTLARMNS